MKTIRLIHELTFLVAVFVYLMRVGAPALDELQKQIQLYWYEQDLSKTFDFAIQKQLNRDDDQFTVVIYDRSKWRLSE